MTASGLARTLPISRQAVAKHLASLREAKLVSSERRGRETVYALRPEPLEDAAAWIDAGRRRVGPRLDALRRSLDSLVPARGRRAAAEGDQQPVHDTRDQVVQRQQPHVGRHVDLAAVLLHRLQHGLGHVGGGDLAV